MFPLSADPQFRIYAACCVVLTFLALLLAGITPAKRAKHKGYMNPEDGSVSKKDAKLVDGAEHPDVARVQRAHRNLNESLPLFFAIGLVSVLAGASPLGVKIGLCTFTGARVLHAIVYLNAKQPWRTMSYAVGAISLVALSVMTLLALFT